MKPWETDETFLARWLNKTLTDEELKAFEASDDFEAYTQTAKALDNFEVGAYDKDAAYTALKNRVDRATPQAPVRRLWSMPYLAIAAAIIVLAGIAYWQLSPSPQLEIIASSRQILDLPDGSKIDLTAGSAVRYDEENWSEKRKLFFTGKAYFDIAKGKTFDILMDQGRVRILGTRFDIIDRNDTIRVNCYEGSVEVQAFGQTNVIKGGQTIISTPNKPPLTQSTYLQQPVWLSNNVQLDNVSLSAALNQISEIYRVNIDGNYEDKQLSRATFPVNNLEVALKQILGPLPSISYQLDTANNVVIIR